METETADCHPGSPAAGRPLPDWLNVRGAREHNLADLAVRLPHRSLVVFTGLSGSGKSTLALDTIYAECRRRQLHSMSAFTRQLLGELDKPDLDEIEGLCSAVALDQRGAGSNPRSTVGTATDIYDLLRVLYARVGCAAPGAPVPELSPRAFSFNLPHGACPDCQGLGTCREVARDLLVPRPELSLAQGALAPWRGPSAEPQYALAMAMARHLGADVDVPWQELPRQVQHTLLEGTSEPVAPLSGATTGPRRRDQVFHGLVPWLRRQADGGRDRAGGYLRTVRCPACSGSRLNAAQRSVRLVPDRPDTAIGEVCTLPVAELLDFLRGLELEADRRAVAEQVMRDVSIRLEHLIEVGLDHLTLDRGTPSLSGGEARRLRLAQQLGTGLFGLLYVLDEPTSGLHPADVDRLLGSLRTLRDQGNSVLVVEHDQQVVRAADWVVDLGPGAGEAGGRLLHSGPLPELLGNEESLTGGHLSGRLRVPPRPYRRSPEPGRVLTVCGASEHNLRDLDVEFPLGCFTVVTGVSGSGKSTLVDTVLYRAVARAVQDEPVVPGEHRRVDGTELVSRVVHVDQSAIGRTPRSNPATYTGAFDPIRTLFARTELARELGLRPGHFSFNTAGGRCETCAGDGMVGIDMRFLPDIEVVCDTCEGTRYQAATLRVTYRDLTIADVLDLPVHAALEVFGDTAAVARPLRALAEVGLGYLRLGQPARSLSGGEAQRVKLAVELAGKVNGHTLYVLDEPTTGLHPEDVRRLLGVLHGLVDRGNTVVVVEHDMVVTASADRVIELGDGGGSSGGRLVATGTPEEIVAAPGSLTARYLRDALCTGTTVQ